MTALSGGVDIAAQRFWLSRRWVSAFLSACWAARRSAAAASSLRARFGAIGFVILFDALLEHGAILLGAVVLFGATALGRLRAALFGTLCGGFPQVLLRRVGPRRW
jgi:hypothetical protein